MFAMLSTMIFFSDILPFALLYPSHQTAKTFATQYLMGEMDHGKTETCLDYCLPRDQFPQKMEKYYVYNK